MSMDLTVTEALAIVTSVGRERKAYTGSGDNRVETGRLMDESGRALSGCSALLVTDTFGIAGEAAVVVRDSQVAALQIGSIVRLDGHLRARLVGGDFGSIRTTLMAERVTPLGDGIAILRDLASKSPKSTENRQAA